MYFSSALLSSFVSSMFLLSAQALPPPVIYTLPNSSVSLIKTYVTFAEAQDTCCNQGLYLAELNVNNWQDATTLTNLHLGVNKMAYIWGWSDNNYEGNVCLTAQTASTLGSMSVNPAPNCNYYLSVLCTNEPPSGLPSTCPPSSSSSTSTVTSTTSMTSTVTSTTTSTSTAPSISSATPTNT